MEFKKPLIKNPCSQNWEGMEPGEMGRFCNACNTLVADLSLMSQAEIIEALNTQKIVCCRLDKDQVEPVKLPRANKERNRYWMSIAASIVAGVIQISVAAAQNPQKPAMVRINRAQLKLKPASIPQKTVLSLEVVDGKTRLPVAYARIYIHELDDWWETDSLGMFTLELKEGDLIPEKFNVEITKKVYLRGGNYARKYSKKIEISTIYQPQKTTVVLSHFKKVKVYKVMGCPSF
jgi:hypothetical protein